MKKAVAAKKPKPAVAPAAKKSAARKTGKRRISKGVRETLIGLLTESPMTRPQLLKKSGCSPASLHNHIKQLRLDGIVAVDETNRVLSLKSSGSAPILEAIVEVIESSSTGSPVPAASSKLFEALDALSFRLEPIQGAKEKLLVLGHLARSTPEPVSTVLSMIFDDIARLSSIKAD